MEDLVSVIIPTYKRKFDMLSRAINSVLAQTYRNIELIIVDDSPEAFPYRKCIEQKIKTEYGQRVKLVKHLQNMGACAARNTGIKKAKGDYIAFLDDDDEWLSNKLELQMEKMEDPEVGLVYCNSKTIYVNRGNKEKIRLSSGKTGNVFADLLKENFIGSTSFVVLKKKVLEDCGVFDEQMQSRQDYELWLRIALKHKVEYVDEVLVNYYVHDGERISTNIDKRIQGRERMLELYMKYLQEHPRFLSLQKLQLARCYTIRDGYKKGLSEWIEAVKLCPFQRDNLKYLNKIIYYTFKR